MGGRRGRGSRRRAGRSAHILGLQKERPLSYSERAVLVFVDRAQPTLPVFLRARVGGASTDRRLFNVGPALAGSFGLERPQRHMLPKPLTSQERLGAL